MVISPPTGANESSKNACVAAIRSESATGERERDKTQLKRANMHGLIRKSLKYGVGVYFSDGV